MDTAVLIALIALAGSAFSTVVTVFGAPFFQARRDARRTLETYREPLLAAAYELQARLHNILKGTFVEDYVSDGSSAKHEAALESTLYVVAQFFGWREIIRQEVQFLRFSRDAKTRQISALLLAIGEVFLSDQFGAQCMIWRVEQRGLGERMIAASSGRATCIGYASFIDQRASMSRWLVPLERDLGQLDEGGRARLTELQHLLLDLVQKLDDGHARYPFELEPA
jgi:hypothetical protein